MKYEKGVRIEKSLTNRIGDFVEIRKDFFILGEQNDN
jgi:hypothetical protein